MSDKVTDLFRAMLSASSVSLAITLAGLFPLPAQDSTNTLNWTAKDGRVIEAKFIKIDGRSVVIEKDGKRFSVPFDKLSLESVELARKLGAENDKDLNGFARIPAGIFQMGDPQEQPIESEWERPAHNVQVNAFYLAKHEVTKALWDEVRIWGLKNGYTDLPDGGGKATNHPVHSINWYAAVKWCNARSEKERLAPCFTVDGKIYRNDTSTPECNWNVSGYRLPTEAEWEKAARGGMSGKRYPWGDTISHDQANYMVFSKDGTSNYFKYDVSPTRGCHPTYNDGVRPYTSPVGSFKPNEYGLYDMIGNIWEWCWDWHSENYYGMSPDTNPRGPTTGSSRVLRGGVWSVFADNCRIARRGDEGKPEVVTDGVGFRVARSLMP